MNLNPKTVSTKRFSVNIGHKTINFHSQFRKKEIRTQLDINRANMIYKNEAIYRRPIQSELIQESNTKINENNSNNIAILNSLYRSGLQTQEINKYYNFSPFNQPINNIPNNVYSNFGTPTHIHHNENYQSNVYEPLNKQNNFWNTNNENEEKKIMGFGFKKQGYEDQEEYFQKNQDNYFKKREFMTEFKQNDRNEKINNNVYPFSTTFKQKIIKKIGDYEFRKDNDSIIGSGTFSTVYRGNHVLNKSIEVAIKVIDTNKCNKNLIDEIYITKSIKSQYVVSIFDYFIDTSKSKCYLILELCNKGSLDKYKFNPVIEGSQTPERLAQIYNYFQQILKGMKPLYDLNIIHRDLKLSNILLKNNQIKISDFGFAKHMGNHTEINSIKCGTPSTMAPEILFENKQEAIFNKKCDIWSLGIILHELIYGVHPFNYNMFDFKNNQRMKLKKKFLLAEDFIDKALRYNPKERINWEEVFEHPINFCKNDEDFIEYRKKYGIKKIDGKLLNFNGINSKISDYNLNNEFNSKLSLIQNNEENDSKKNIKFIFRIFITFVIIYILFSKLMKLL